MNTDFFASDKIRQHLETARQQIAHGDLKAAATTLNLAQTQQPNDARVFMLAALMAEKSGNVAKAFESLRTSVALAPNWGPGMLELALLLARHNQFPEAIQWAQKVAALEPKNPQVLAGVIDIAHRAGNLEMAVQHLERGLQLFPGDATLMAHLAGDLQKLQRIEDSLRIWDQLLEQSPRNPQHLLGRVQTLVAAGRPGDALANTTLLLEIAPDSAIAQYYHQIAQGQTPEHQPIDVHRELFDGMAEGYDMHMVRGLRYQLPQLIARKILDKHPDKHLNILDLGCGTGLLGVFLGKTNGHLIGVDTSTKMIEQAARHNVYDRFHTVNLEDALRETPEDLYEVITALDVFIYTGDLQVAIPNAWRILRAGGSFYFSCETAPADGPALVLQPSGRYAHTLQSVEAMCHKAGFASVQFEEQVLRLENGEPVHGFVVTATKAAD